MVTKIISGGQTGVDRAALDIGIHLGYEIGGYVPRGRKSEDGVVPDFYPMVELDTDDYAERTKRNIAACGATIILLQNERDMRGGTLLTRNIVSQSNYCVGCIINMERPTAAVSLMHFWSVIEKCEPSISVVNFAGPRESKSPGVYRMAHDLLMRVIPPARNT